MNYHRIIFPILISACCTTAAEKSMDAVKSASPPVKPQLVSEQDSRGAGAVDLQTRRHVSNQVAAGTASVVAGGQGNHSREKAATVAGGAENVAARAFSTVSGGERNAADGEASIVGGGGGNKAAGAFSAIVGGSANRAEAIYSAVLSGRDNLAKQAGAIVAGGADNLATGQDSFIGGGFRNVSSKRGSTVVAGGANHARGIYAVVSGGLENVSSGLHSVVSGGHGNRAVGVNSTVPGGYRNEASGRASFAAGRRAKAKHDGAFVFADTEDEDFSSMLEGEFAVRASRLRIERGSLRVDSRVASRHGGSQEGRRVLELSAPDLPKGANWNVDLGSKGELVFVSDDGTVHCALETGASGWLTPSDRQTMLRVKPLEGLLEKVMRLEPIAYRERDGQARQIGLSAQTVQADLPEVTAEVAGRQALRYDRLSVVAIGALKEHVEMRDRQIRDLQRENRDLQARLDEVMKRLIALENPAASNRR